MEEVTAETMAVVMEVEITVATVEATVEVTVAAMEVAKSRYDNQIIIIRKQTRSGPYFILILRKNFMKH